MPFMYNPCGHLVPEVKEVKISIEILTIVMNDIKTVALKDQVLNSILKTVRR